MAKDTGPRGPSRVHDSGRDGVLRRCFLVMYRGPSGVHDFSMRTFRPYDLDQPYLLPPDLRSWLSEGHLALFVSDVVDALDLAPIDRTSVV